MMKELLCAEMASQTAAEMLSSLDSSSDPCALFHAPDTRSQTHLRGITAHICSVNVAEHTIRNSKMRLSVFSRHGYSFKFTATQGRQVIIWGQNKINKEVSCTVTFWTFAYSVPTSQAEWAVSIKTNKRYMLFRESTRVHKVCLATCTFSMSYINLPVCWKSSKWRYSYSMQ